MEWEGGGQSVAFHASVTDGRIVESSCKLNPASLALVLRGRLEPAEGYPCDSTKTKITFSSVNIPIFEKEVAIVFPNPTSGTIQIDMPPNVGELNFQLFDMAGKPVFTKKSILSFEKIQLTDVVNGMYFYKIFDKKGRTWSGKVVVNR